MVLGTLVAVALAQEPSVPAEIVSALEHGRAVPVAVTVSGGGSLGAYEAGWLYYLSEVHKLNPGVWDVRVLTGTSAGGINTFVALLSMCGPVEPSPRDSVYFQTWMPIGVWDLFDPEATVADGVLDREGFEAVLSGLRGRFEGGLADGCALDWGVAVSRLDPRDVPLAGGYSAPLAQEHLVVRVVGRGDGEPPSVTARVPPRVGYAQPVLPVGDPEADVFGLLRDAAFATSAFPVAFRPMVLPTCLVPQEGDPAACTLAGAHRDAYVDGGLYDNAPIRLAHRLAVADRLDPAYVYVDAYLGRFPAPPVQDEEPTEARTADLVGRLAGGLVGVSGVRPLATMLEEEPNIVERLSVGVAYAPQFGRELGAFFGLFQHELREADFWLGIYSAYRETRDRSPAFRLLDLNTPEATDPAWAPFWCLAATYEGTDPAPCSDPAAQRLVPAFQVAAERLYAWCRATPVGTTSGLTSEHCEAARAGEAPPRVPGASESGPDWGLAEGEDPLNHALRRLAWHGFVFTDLGESVPSERRSRRAVRETLGELVGALAAANGGQRIVIALVGDVMVERFVPAPKPPPKDRP